MSITVQQVQILYTGEMMETLLDDITIDHLLVCLTNFQDLILDLILENSIEMLHIRVL